MALLCHKALTPESVDPLMMTTRSRAAEAAALHQSLTPDTETHDDWKNYIVDYDHASPVHGQKSS